MQQILWVWGAAILGSLVIGCSSGDGSAGGGVVVTPLQAAEQLAPIFCRRLSECDPARFQASYRTREQCIADFTAEERASRHKDEYGAQSDVDACARELETRSCESVMENGGKCSAR